MRTNTVSQKIIPPFTRITLIVSILPAIWICLFQYLKFFPFQFSLMIFLTTIIWIVVIIKNHKLLFEDFTRENIITGFFIFLLSFWLIPLAFFLIAPSGGDMSSHSYIARLISEYDTYPLSYEPLVPIQTFGSYFTGMPTIIAALSKLTNLPVYKSALFVTIGSYGFFVFAVYVFARLYFGKTASILVVLTIMLISNDTTYYLPWGGNPMILSTSFLLLAATYGILVFRKSIYSLTGALVIIILFGASFFTHYIPPIIAGYIFSVVGVFAAVRQRKFPVVYISCVIIGFLFLTLPFFTSLKIPSATMIEAIRDWQQGDHGHVWRGTISNALWSIPEYILGRLGPVFAVIVTSGILFAFILKIRDRWLYLLACGLLCIIIGNSKYWILPLSPLLYPERAITAGTAVWIYFGGSLFHFCTVILQKILHRNNPIHSFVLFLVIGMSCYFIFPYMAGRYMGIIQKPMNEVSVTSDDMNVFAWIEQHTRPGDVIDNNYGDAGIWIPAIAYRKVTYNDAGPFDQDELFAAQSSLNAKYIFVGAKKIYTKGDHMRFTNELLESDPSVTLLFSSGNARIYSKK